MDSDFESTLKTRSSVLHDFYSSALQAFLSQIVGTLTEEMEIFRTEEEESI